MKAKSSSTCWGANPIPIFITTGTRSRRNSDSPNGASFLLGGVGRWKHNNGDLLGPFLQDRGGQRKCMGVVGADISLEAISKIVSSIKILRTGDGFLISRNGAFVTHKRPELIMNETIFGIAESPERQPSEGMGRRMINGLSGSSRYTSILTGRPSFIYYAPVKSSGWSVGVVFPQVEFDEDVNRIRTSP